MRDGLHALVEETGADELILATQVHDHAARVRSMEIVMRELKGGG